MADVDALTEQVEGLSIDYITANYADNTYGKIQRINKVESMLSKTDVVLFGEGDFTFTVALAAIQRSWDRILSTRFEPATDEYPLPPFNSVQHDCVIYCQHNGQHLGIPQDEIDTSVQHVNALAAPPREWLCGIDATNNDLLLAEKVAWFQCPWIPRNSPAGTTASLITDFLEHMATKQTPGDHVLIGITTRFPYVKDYDLGGLLDFTQGIASNECSCPRYDFMGADDSFIKKILQFGYHHQGVLDIHDAIMKYHITLIFKRNSQSENNA